VAKSDSSDRMLTSFVVAIVVDDDDDDDGDTVVAGNVSPLSIIPLPSSFFTKPSSIPSMPSVTEYPERRG